MRKILEKNWFSKSVEEVKNRTNDRFRKRAYRWRGNKTKRKYGNQKIKLKKEKVYL